jgi:hypothetical protein
MEMPALFKSLFSKRVEVQLPAAPPPTEPPKPAAAPMTEEQLQMCIAVAVVAVVGVALATIMGSSGSSLRDGSMRLLASAANEASAKIDALKQSSQ